MDQIKTGKFIAAMRKEKGLTQRQLADNIGVSDKTVSKWECGKGMPELSLMLPLCNALDINVNELLTGERLTESEYKERAEQNMINLVKEREESKKKIIIAIVVALMSLVSSITIFMVVQFFEMKTSAKAILICIGLLVLLAGVMVASIIEKEAGAFECRKCGARFVPSMGAYIAGPHSITTRYLKCPECGKYSYCKKRLTKTM